MLAGSKRTVSAARGQSPDVVRRTFIAQNHVAATRREPHHGSVSRRQQRLHVGLCTIPEIAEGHQTSQVLEGPISKDACTLQDVILSGQRVDDKTGIRMARALLVVLAHRHQSTPQMPHGNIKPDTVYFPKGIQSSQKDLKVMFLKPLPTGTAPCGPDQAHLSPASATAQYIAPEHLAAAQLHARKFGATQPLQPVNLFSANHSSFRTMNFEPDVRSNGHITPLSADAMNWGLDASVHAFSLQGVAATSFPTSASDCYQLGCVLMFAATGAQSQQFEVDLEARVFEVPDARGGPVGKVLSSGTKFSALIRGLLAANEQDRLTAERALALIDDKTWPPLPQGACIPFSSPEHVPESFCFTNRKPLAQPWSSFHVTQADCSKFFSTVAIKDDALVVSMPVSPGIFERWVAPGALLAGCGAMAWWLARAGLTSAQPALLAAAVPFGAAGAFLGSIVHQEGSQLDLLEIRRDSWGLTAGVSRCSSSGSNLDAEECMREVLEGCKEHPEFLGKTDRLLGAKVVSLEVVDDERTDTAILLCTACGHHMRFGSHLSLQEQQWVVATINSHLAQRLQQPVTVENDLFPSTHAHIDVDDFD